jgi:hypothetical protein
MAARFDNFIFRELPPARTVLGQPGTPDIVVQDVPPWGRGEAH